MFLKMAQLQKYFTFKENLSNTLYRGDSSENNNIPIL